ncbi:MAG: bifunctional demethylmenaquinone methyltransferase/2-methoxy-6-polyprenyl-1,4-benzoquinol methylase UbiE [Acidobacteriota bacterium]|nr:bifunctional demethylmenaquinone methyltransferase/2-methoxy-6-polyprenyl-1,4-benzoquinol methylase UbiE [Acidobacteriota bacterium]
MFGRVAHRYDLANHLLSFNIDRYWRGRTVRKVSRLLKAPGTRVLDLCCGTGDLLIALQEQRSAIALGSDFCHPMLTAARAKVAARRLPAKLFEADALHLPLADGSLDLVTIAFGFRNLANYESGLRELRRVLRPGAMLAILEFSQPPNRAFAGLYRLYSRSVLPLVGGALSGSRDAYAYLPESVRKFPSAEELARQMTDAGFDNVSFERMTGGIVALHFGSVV